MTGPLKRLLESRFRISTQLYLGLGGAVILTMGASLVGWYYFNRMGEAQRFINEGSVPEIVAAFGVAQQSGALTAAAPRLTAAATPEDFARVAAEIASEQDAFEAQLTALTAFEAQLTPLTPQRGAEERFARIRANGAALIANITAIDRSVSERFALSARSTTLRAELDQVRAELDGILIPAIDDQLFFAITGFRALSKTPAQRPLKYRKRNERDAGLRALSQASDPRQQNFSAAEFHRYRHLADLLGDATIAIQLLANAFTLADAAQIEPLRERFEAAAGRVERKRSAIGAAPAHDRMAQAFERLFQMGLGQESGFNLRSGELDLAARQQDLLAQNRSLAIDLLTEVHSLVGEARRNTEEATRASSEAILTGQRLLLALNVVSIVGAVLIAYLFVGRVLLRRLERLSNRMRGMASGDLETEVDISGRDEVADMAAALEVFRRHALEVQRLNLVEKLAEELQGKNEQLENVLADLRRAQDQIIMREKLAALGELTAGVAHEIKNPLNFVKNFSEVSTELLEELQEILQEEVKLGEEPGELIDEICGDLTGNLQRICEHGERANAIVHAMLSMGRGGGERQPADINLLLDEHARLAYHSARASDPDFNLTIQKDFDPEAGLIEVVPQDMGRVFLNLVSNACYATDEKRRGDSGSGERYDPILSMTTRRLDDRIEITVRDNGCGIPPHVVDKIFNPFFTTKPTDEGTGLGLALSNDIVREQGGVIRVESEPGQFTEMIIELPLTPPS